MVECTAVPILTDSLITASVKYPQNIKEPHVIQTSDDTKKKSVVESDVLIDNLSDKDNKPFQKSQPLKPRQEMPVASTTNIKSTMDSSVKEAGKSRTTIIVVSPKGTVATKHTTASVIYTKKSERSGTVSQSTSKEMTGRTFSLRDKPKKDYKELLAGKDIPAKKDDAEKKSADDGNNTVTEIIYTSASAGEKLTGQVILSKGKNEKMKISKGIVEKEKLKVTRRKEEPQSLTAKRKQESQGSVCIKKQKLDVREDRKSQKTTTKEKTSSVIPTEVIPLIEDTSETVIGESESLEEFQRRTETVKQVYKKSCKPYECDFNFEEDGAGINKTSSYSNLRETSSKQQKMSPSSSRTLHGCVHSHDTNKNICRSETSRSVVTLDSGGKEKPVTRKTKQVSSLTDTLPPMALKLVTSCSSSKTDAMDPIFSPHIFTCDNVKRYTRQHSNEKEKTSKPQRVVAPVSVILSDKNSLSKKSPILIEKKKVSKPSVQNKILDDVQEHAEKDVSVSKVRALRQLHKADKPFEWDSGSPVRETRSKGKDKEIDDSISDRNAVGKREINIKLEPSPVRESRSRSRSLSSHDSKKAELIMDLSKDNSNTSKMLRGRKKAVPHDDLCKSLEEIGSSSVRIKSKKDENSPQTSKTNLKSAQEKSDDTIRGRRASSRNRPVDDDVKQEQIDPLQEEEKLFGGKKLKTQEKSVEAVRIVGEKMFVQSPDSSKCEASRSRDGKLKGSRAEPQASCMRERKLCDIATLSLRSRSGSQDKVEVDKQVKRIHERSISPSKSEKKKSLDSEKKTGTGLIKQNGKQLKSKQEAAKATVVKVKAEPGNKAGKKGISAGKTTASKTERVTCKLDGTSSSPYTTPVKDSSVQPECSLGHSVFQEDCADCSGDPAMLKGQRYVYENKRAPVRQIIHKGKVFEIQKGSVTETDIQKRRGAEATFRDTSPVRTMSSSATKPAANNVTGMPRTRSTTNSESPIPTPTGSRKRVRSPDTETMGEKKIVTSSNINKYISETLKKIKIERESTSHQKWTVQKKAHLKGPIFPYSFKKS